MKRTSLLLSIIFMVTMVFAGCRDNSIGDGKVDLFETAAIRLAVDTVFEISPEAVPSTFVVSEALMTAIDTGSITNILGIDEFLLDAVDSLDTTEAVKDLVIGLLAELEESVLPILSKSKLTNEQRLKVIRQIAAIVRSAAYDKL